MQKRKKGSLVSVSAVTSAACLLLGFCYGFLNTWQVNREAELPELIDTANEVSAPSPALGPDDPVLPDPFCSVCYSILFVKRVSITHFDKSEEIGLFSCTACQRT